MGGGESGREMLVDLWNMGVCLLWPQSQGREKFRTFGVQLQRNVLSDLRTPQGQEVGKPRIEMDSSARRMDRPPPLYGAVNVS